MNVSDFYNEINKLAPFETAMSFDNCGLLIGNPNQTVKNCIFALDITNNVIDSAIEKQAQLIITHHPVIFDRLANIPENSVVYRLIQNNISVISAHTNLDIAKNGVNDTLAKLCGLEKFKRLP
ncbi:MAG: Nif3-like dinuclear metal center hexameric protein, partial [Oscillospiraceae bacterium]